jgi:hypothetical protein
VLLAITIAMYAIATPYFRSLRGAVGVPSRYGPKDAPVPAPRTDAEIAAIAAQSPVTQLALVGFGGLLIILWLMVLKPF